MDSGPADVNGSGSFWYRVVPDNEHAEHFEFDLGRRNELQIDSFPTTT